MGFNSDLKLGHIYEKKALKYLEYDEYKIMEGCFKPYDIELIKDKKKTKIEVKCCRKGIITGNLVIEYMCNKKKSGISSTEADFWLYFMINPSGVDILYKFKTDDLKKLIKNCKSVNGGDGWRSKMYLLPRKGLEIYIQ